MALQVAGNAVARPRALRIHHQALVRQRAGWPDVVTPDQPVRPGAAFHHVQHRTVRREGQAVGAGQVRQQRLQPACRRIQAEHPLEGQLGFGRFAFPEAVDAERRVGEPQRAVPRARDVIGRVQPPAFEAFGQHRDRAVVLGAGDAARQVLAAHQPSLQVPCMPVGVVRGLAEHADRARALVPAQDAVVRDVRYQQVASVAEPHRALGPVHAGGQLLHRAAEQPQRQEGWVQHLDRGVGVAQAHGALAYLQGLT